MRYASAGVLGGFLFPPTLHRPPGHGATGASPHQAAQEGGLARIFEVGKTPVGLDRQPAEDGPAEQADGQLM